MEEWRPVRGYEGLYEVSSFGRVRRVSGGQGAVAGRILKSDRTGPYHKVNLYRDKKPRLTLVHRLVCEAFHGPAPDGKPNALHNNGDTDNNSVTNVRWGSQGENILDTVKHGRHNHANKTHCKRDHKFTVENTRIDRTTGSRHCRTCEKERR